MNGNRSFTEVLIAWRRLVYRLTALAVLGAVVVALLLPEWYAASAVVTPPREGDSGAGLMALMDQFRSGTGTGRARSLLKGTPEIDAMIGVLKSRHVRGQVVDRFSLMETYGVKKREAAIKQLGNNLSVSTTPEGFVQVRVLDRDRRLAADVANGLVEFLDRYNREKSVEDARRTREFVSSRLEEVRERLERASNALRQFQEKHGAVLISEQTRVTVEAMAALEGERTQLEIQKGVLGSYARGEQPQILEIEMRIAEIDKWMARLRGGAPRPASGDEPGADSADTDVSDVLIPLGDFPRLGLEYAELKREVLAQEKVYEFLMAQFEEARIREARDLETVSVLDPAVPPNRKSRPRRSLIVVLSAGLAFALSIGVAFGAEALGDAARQRPEWSEAGEIRWLLRLVGLLRRLGGPAAP